MCFTPSCSCLLINHCHPWYFIDMLLGKPYVGHTLNPDGSGWLKPDNTGTATLRCWSVIKIIPVPLSVFSCQARRCSGVRGRGSRRARTLRMLHLPPRRFSCQKAASARHVPAGHRKARAAAFPQYYFVIRAGVDSWTEPARSLLPPHTIKWPHSAACGLQAAQPGQALPGTQQGKPPRRFWGFFSTCNANLQKKSCTFHPSSPPAVCPITVEMAAAPRPTGLYLSPPGSPPLQGAWNAKYCC